MGPLRGRGSTCKGFFIGLWPVDVALCDVWSKGADFSDLALWHRLGVLVKNGHPHRALGDPDAARFMGPILW